MSSSEKLKALEGRRQWTEGFARSKADAILYDALPQIVAVIEAAEKHKDNGFAYYGLGNALAELDKALS